MLSSTLGLELEANAGRPLDDGSSGSCTQTTTRICLKGKREETRGLREELRSSWAHYEALGDARALHDAARQALGEQLTREEEIVVVVAGMSSSMVVGTDRRVFVVKNEFSSGGAREISVWDHREISGIQLETGHMSGLVVVNAAAEQPPAATSLRASESEPWRAKNVLPLNRANFDRARRGVAVLQNLIAASGR